MCKLGEILKKIRNKRGYSLVKLQELSGVTQGYISDIENNRNSVIPKKDKLEEIIKALKPSEEEKIEIIEKYSQLIMTEEMLNIIKKSDEKKEKSNVKILDEEDFVEMPVKAKASAGNGYINFEDTLYTRLIRKGNFCTDCYLIEVSGNSMEPLIQDGAFVIVDPHQTEYIANKIYVVKVDEETYVKRVIINRESGIMILKSINPDYEDKYIIGKELENVKLLGRAIKFVYEGNL